MWKLSLKYLILSHFDVIEGPKILLKAPELSEDKALEQIPQLLNLFDEGFFVQIFSEFKSTNLLFNIPSDYARGRQEILLLSIILDIDKDIDLNLAQNLLIDFERNLKRIPEAYKAFYIGSHKFIGDREKLEEVRNIFLDFYDYSQKTMKALEEAEVRYRALFKAARDAIFIIDKKSGIIVDANKQAEKLLQRPIEEIIGMDAIELQIEKEYERVRLEILEAVKSEEGSLIETVVDNYQGKKIPVEITANEIEIGGRRLIQGIFRDITERKETEKKLKESEEKYRLITENANDLITIINKKLYFEYVNEQTLYKMLGYSITDLIGKSVFKFIHTEDQGQVLKDFIKSRETGRGSSIARLRHKNGNYIWVETNGVQFIDNDGIEKSLVATRDINFRKLTEQKLQQSEEKYRTISDQSLMAIQIYQDGEIVYANKALTDFTEYSFEEIKSWEKFGVLNIIHPDDIDFVFDLLNLKENGIKQSNEPYLARIITKSQKIKWAQMLFRAHVYQDKLTLFLTMIDFTDQIKAEQQLKESEEKYRLIYENANDIIAILDHKFLVEYINESALKRITGFSAEDIIGKNAVDFALPEDRKRATKDILRGFRDGEATGEFRAMNAKSEKIWLEVRGKLFKDAEGNDKGIIIAREITDRKNAEQKLKESEEHYRLITENANDLIIILNDKFEFEYLNEKIINKVMGYKKEELIGNLVMNFIHPDDINQAVETLTKGFLIGEGDLVLRVKHKEGHWVWVEARGTTFSTKDRELKAYIIVRDITEKKEAEQKLKESEEKYRLLIENQSDLIIKYNGNGRVLFVSPTYCRAYGINENEILEKIYKPKIHPDDVENVSKASKFLFKPPYIAQYEHRIPTKEGWKWFSWIDKAILDDNNRVSEILSVGRDITKEQELKDLIKESEEKYRYIYENSPEAFVLTNKEGIILDYNFSTGKILGFSKDEVIGKNYMDFGIYSNEQIKTLIRRYIQLLKGNQPEPIEFKIKRKDGTKIWIKLYSNLLYMKEEPLILTFIQDITEKKKAELNLIESELKYKLIMEHADDVIAIIDQNFNVECINQLTLTSILGYTFKEIFENHPNRILHPEDTEYARKAIDLGFKTGELLLDLRIKHKQGHYLWIEIKGRSFLDMDGEIKLITITRDISPRKKIELKLKESEKRYREYLENLSDIIVESSLNGEISYISNPVYDVLGYKPEELIGQNGFKLMHPDDMNKLKEAMDIVIKTGTDIALEYKIQHKDGFYVPIYAKGTLLKLEDQIKFIGVLRDLSEEKEAEQELRVSEEKYRNLFNNSPHMIAIAEIEGKIIDLNRALLTFLGYSREELIEKDFRELAGIPKDALPHFEKLIEEIKRTGLIKPITINILKKDKTPVKLTLHGSIIDIEGKNLAHLHLISEKS